MILKEPITEQDSKIWLKAENESTKITPPTHLRRNHHERTRQPPTLQEMRTTRSILKIYSRIFEFKKGAESLNIIKELNFNPRYHWNKRCRKFYIFKTRGFHNNLPLDSNDLWQEMSINGNKISRTLFSHRVWARDNSMEARHNLSQKVDSLCLNLLQVSKPVKNRYRPFHRGLVRPKSKLWVARTKTL